MIQKKLRIPSDIFILMSIKQNLFLTRLSLNHIFQSFIPSLSKEAAEFLYIPPTLTELKDVLSSMKRSKSPGMDGFPPELFLDLWDSIGPLLLNSFNYALRTSSFHRDQNTSLISVLLKVDRVYLVRQGFL